MKRVMKAIPVLLVFILLGIEVNAQTDPQLRVVVIPMSGESETSGKFVGMVTNQANPFSAGTGVPALWSYAGQTGIVAGDMMCQAIGGDHPCTYAELLAAEARGELAGVKAMEGQSFWVHRVATVTVSSPGPGGRCNDWKEAHNGLSDGEFAHVSAGVINYVFDEDTVYTGDPADEHQGSNPVDGGPCDITPALMCCK